MTTYTVREAAAVSGVRRATIHKRIERGLYPNARKARRWWMIPASDIEDFERNGRDRADTSGMPEEMGTGEVAGAFGVGVWTVSRWCKSEALPARKIGRTWIIRREDLREFRRPRGGARRIRREEAKNDEH